MSAPSLGSDRRRHSSVASSQPSEASATDKVVTCGTCGEQVSLLDYKDHAAICKLSSSLQREEFAIPITHGDAVSFEGRTNIQAHAAPVRGLSDVEYVVDKLQHMPPWDSCLCRPHAYRFVEYS